MQGPRNFLRRKYAWAATFSLMLVLATTYTMLDAFVIPKAYAPLQSGQAIAEATETPVRQQSLSGPVITDTSYQDDNISITIETVHENGTVYYVADVTVSDISYLKTAFAKDTFGKNITETTSAMAAANDAIFAVNGDYYGFRDTGLIIRNGVLYRDQARSSPDNQALTIDSTGSLGIVTEGNVSGSTLISAGVLQSFSFGPALVEKGQITASAATVAQQASSRKTTRNTQAANPRTAIGQIEPLHYLFVVVDGRSSESGGMTLAQLAQVFIDRGCSVAYNLDGGGSSSMWFMGTLVNNPTDGRNDGERSISDILYIGEGAV